MSKFFVNSDQIDNSTINIIDEDVNHIKNVLRLKLNEKITICDKDTSTNYLCEIKNIDNKIIKCEIIEKMKSETESNIKLTIMQGLPKADKMELIIQKGTELGVSEFIPVAFKRSIVKLSGKDEVKKIERWNKISEVASKQSGRDIVPNVSLVKSIKQISEIIKDYDLVLVAYELEKNNYIKYELQKINKIDEELKIAVIIGPEGGIDPEEVEILANAGAKVITLGKRILRTETVALNVSSIIMYELENGGI